MEYYFREHDLYASFEWDEMLKLARSGCAAAGRDWQQPRRTHRKATTPPRDAHPRDANPVGIPGAPQLPPHPGWTTYQDNGMLWWYYEGSRGKWWCQEGRKGEPDASSLAPFDDSRETCAVQ